jgi:hypothetical protein
VKAILYDLDRPSGRVFDAGPERLVSVDNGLKGTM